MSILASNKQANKLLNIIEIVFYMTFAVKFKLLNDFKKITVAAKGGRVQSLKPNQNRNLNGIST